MSAYTAIADRPPVAAVFAVFGNFNGKPPHVAFVHFPHQSLLGIRFYPILQKLHEIECWNRECLEGHSGVDCSAYPLMADEMLYCVTRRVGPKRA